MNPHYNSMTMFGQQRDKMETNECKFYDFLAKYVHAQYSILRTEFLKLICIISLRLNSVRKYLFKDDN